MSAPVATVAVLLLGSNLGRRVRNLREALQRLSRETDVLAVSRLYAGEPQGRGHQPWFLNQAVRIATRLCPEELLLLAKRLEQGAGRRGGGRWGPRTLDVDIILYGEAVVSRPHLAIPHPAMAGRRFCLLPVAEVASDAVVPPGGRTVIELLAMCNDTLEV
ncbi:MAG TPA: 2-amino-4-hydroxy-6-hydroxymethyldihydropteridine diphosphokinase, partial [Candidatus Deferrimicrobiaceae bacterium]